jgi:hypothetical protein
MAHARGHFGLAEIACRRAEEIQYRLRLPRRRVHHVHHDIRVRQYIGQALSRDGIDAGARRGGQRLMTRFGEQRDDT